RVVAGGIGDESVSAGGRRMYRPIVEVVHPTTDPPGEGGSLATRGAAVIGQMHRGRLRGGSGAHRSDNRGADLNASSEGRGEDRLVLCVGSVVGAAVQVINPDGRELVHEGLAHRRVGTPAEPLAVGDEGDDPT